MTAMDFRQYDNALGRFHGVDLLAELDYSGSPYSFGFNNPVYFSDPSGLFPGGRGKKDGESYSDDDGSWIWNGNDWIGQGDSPSFYGMLDAVEVIGGGGNSGGGGSPSSFGDNSSIPAIPSGGIPSASGSGGGGGGGIASMSPMGLAALNQAVISAAEMKSVAGNQEQPKNRKLTPEQQQKLDQILYEEKMAWQGIEVIYDDNIFSALGHQLSFALPSATFSGLFSIFSRSVKSKGGSNIALGVTEHLDDFARSVNGNTWKTWGAQDFHSQFKSTINNSANKIHFNMTGPDGTMLNPWKAVTEGAKGLGFSRATSWELFQLYSNPGALQRSTFYFNGKVIVSPF